MNRYSVTLALVALVAVLACQKQETGAALGTTYQRIARPAIWRVLPRTQAESLGLEPGDLIVSYNGEPVKTTGELVQLQFRSVASQEKLPMTVLRGEAEVKVEATPGVLGVLPNAERYPGALAVAIKDILGYYGVVADYDWLAALTGESFAFTARREGCRGAWPDGLAGDYVEGLTEYYGLTFRTVFAVGDSARPPAEVQSEASAAVQGKLGRGKPVLVYAVWPGSNGYTWGIAARYNPGDSAVYGYTVGSAGEVRLCGPIAEAYEVSFRAAAGADPADMLTTVLSQALELGQTSSDTGWQSGIAAYDLWIQSLDTIPFCPVCPDSGRECFDRLVWTLLANKESANRFLKDMREALPDQIDLLDRVIAENEATIGKLQGIVQSGIRVGTKQSQEKLARTVNAIQLDETNLLGLYDELIGEL
ncbi:hypothetical protein JXD38_03815 [candidate division WOR-3 bacterium]|nr:hypothetical protein [candidate division WOR-3 bacterium]